jgi:hypothetical protein
VDRDRALTAALRSLGLDQHRAEVDVVDIETEQLRPAQPAEGHQRQQQPVALHPPAEPALPDPLSRRDLQQAGQLAGVEHVGQRLALLRGAQRDRRVLGQVLVLDTEAKEAANRNDRPRPASRRGPRLGLGREEAPQVRDRDLLDPLHADRGQEGHACADVAAVDLAGQLRQTALDLAVAEEVLQLVNHVRAVLPGTPLLTIFLAETTFRLTGLLRKSPAPEEFFYGLIRRRVVTLATDSAPPAISLESSGAGARPPAVSDPHRWPRCYRRDWDASTSSEWDRRDRVRAGRLRRTSDGV